MTDGHTLAMYLLCGKDTYHQLAAWQRIAKAPYAKPLTSPYITMLTQRITEQHRMDLLKLRAARRRITNFTPLIPPAEQVIPFQISVAGTKTICRLHRLWKLSYTRWMLTCPYYRTFAGNTPDSRSLETILHDLEHGIQGCILITDRGYESIRNLEIYIDRKQPMIMGTKVGQKHVRKEIDAFGTFDHHPKEWRSTRRNGSTSNSMTLSTDLGRDNIKQADT